jgi:hypothetical protein
MTKIERNWLIAGGVAVAAVLAAVAVSSSSKPAGTAAAAPVTQFTPGHTYSFTGPARGRTDTVAELQVAFDTTLPGIFAVKSVTSDGTTETIILQYDGAQPMPITGLAAGTVVTQLS